MWSDALNRATKLTHGLLQSKAGICVPVFKNKGDGADRKNYRNLVMLSVAVKLIARIAAARLSDWAEQFMAEEQQGFRRNRGVDDAVVLPVRARFCCHAWS